MAGHHAAPREGAHTQHPRLNPQIKGCFACLWGAANFKENPGKHISLPTWVWYIYNKCYKLSSRGSAASVLTQSVRGVIEPGLNQSAQANQGSSNQITNQIPPYGKGEKSDRAVSEIRSEPKCRCQSGRGFTGASRPSRPQRSSHSPSPSSETRPVKAQICGPRSTVDAGWGRLLTPVGTVWAPRSCPGSWRASASAPRWCWATRSSPESRLYSCSSRRPSLTSVPNKQVYIWPNKPFTMQELRSIKPPHVKGPELV